MGLIECASYKSVARGYDYYEDKKVLNVQEIDEYKFSAQVKGGENVPYNVEIDIEHPRRSKCNCPHANGKRIVCKHMIALYFTVFPEEAKKYYDRVIQEQREYEDQQEMLSEALDDYVMNLSPDEARGELLNLIYDLPDWLYQRYLEEHFDDIIKYSADPKMRNSDSLDDYLYTTDDEYDNDDMDEYDYDFDENE